MRAIVLGAAAGGGFPQWNSCAEGCRRARRNESLAKPRTQTSVAVSADGSSWILLNASPDIRQQIEQTSCLQPVFGPRASPIVAVVLTGGEIDAIAGLLTLRERQPLAVLATAATHAVLDANPIFEVLSRDVVTRTTVRLDSATPIPCPDGTPTGLTVSLFPVPGKIPLHVERPGIAPLIQESEATVGCTVTDGMSTLLFIPSCAAVTPALAGRLRGADTVLFDGTLATDDEMIRAGLGPKTAARMGHMSVFGSDGTLACFAGLGVRRPILIHLNNSNPILLEDSAVYAAVRAAGWDVAYDGMEIAW